MARAGVVGLVVGNCSLLHRALLPSTRSALHLEIMSPFLWVNRPIIVRGSGLLRCQPSRHVRHELCLGQDSQKLLASLHALS